MEPRQSQSHRGRLAGASPRGLGRYLCNTASLDTGGRKDPARPCADDQSLVAGSAVRNLPWTDDVADPVRRSEFSDRLRFHRPLPDDPDEQRRNRIHRCSAREPSRISTPRSWAGCAVLGWKPGSGPCRSRYENAIPFERDSEHSFLRSGICQPVLAHSAAGGSGLHPVPIAIPRQGQPGAFLLGQLRPRGHTLLRTHRRPR